MNRFAYAIPAIIALFLVFVPLAGAQNEHPDLKDGKVKVGSVLVLPPEVTAMKAGVKSNDPEMEKALKVEDQMSAGIVDAMNGLGCKAVAGPSTDETPNGDNDMKYALPDLQKQFDLLDRELWKKHRDVRKGRFTMGDTVNKLNPGGGTDALVFTRVYDQEVTGGEIAMVIFSGFGSSPDFVLEIAVVDARTGIVLYYGRDSALNDKKASTVLVRDILKKFPCSAGGTSISASSSATHP